MYSTFSTDVSEIRGNLNISDNFGAFPPEVPFRRYASAPANPFAHTSPTTLPPTSNSMQNAHNPVEVTAQKVDQLQISESKHIQNNGENSLVETVKSQVPVAQPFQMQDQSPHQQTDASPPLMVGAGHAHAQSSTSSGSSKTSVKQRTVANKKKKAAAKNKPVKKTAASGKGKKGKGKGASKGSKKKTAASKKKGVKKTQKKKAGKGKKKPAGKSKSSRSTKPKPKKAKSAK